MRYCLNYFGTRSLLSTILRKLKLLNFLVDSVLNLRIFSVAQIAFSDFIDKKSIILQVESRGREFLFCSSLVSFGLMGSKLVSQVTGFGGSLNTSQPLNRLCHGDARVKRSPTFEQYDSLGQFYPMKKRCYGKGIPLQETL